MERVKIDKMECRFPVLFKAMWVITIEWLIISITNYYGQWLLQNRLDGVGIEIALALIAMVSFLISTEELLWLNVVVVLIACAFLYDIWRFADFKETEISMAQIKGLISEED